MSLFLGDTLGMAILDSGCSKTVCGKKWMSTYLDTLSVQDRKCVRRTESQNKFRFGDGRFFPSYGRVYIPIYIGSKQITLCTDTVSCDIPLLLSRETLQKLSTVINFKDNEVSMLGQSISIVLSDSGHYCLPLTREMNIHNKHTDMILLNTNFGKDKDADRKKVIKLHRQFAHPSAEKLIKLLKEAGVKDQNLFKLVTEVSVSCDTCARHKRSPLRPAVGFPLASTFNDCLAVDLKAFGHNVYILHIIDHMTRFSSGCIIYTRRRELLLKDLWKTGFGSLVLPTQYFVIMGVSL